MGKSRLQRTAEKYVAADDGHREIEPDSYGAEGKELVLGTGYPARLYRPQGAEGPLPGLVFIHGGSFVSESYLDCQRGLMYLASSGFAVVSLEYPRFCEGSYRQALQTLSDGIVKVLGEGIVAPDSLFILGAGTGALPALNLSQRTDFKTRGIVLNHPVIGMKDCLREIDVFDRIIVKGALFPGKDKGALKHMVDASTLFSEVAASLPEIFVVLSDGDTERVEASQSSVNLLSNYGARIRLLRESDTDCGYLFNLRDPNSLRSTSANSAILSFVTSHREAID